MNAQFRKGWRAACKDVAKGLRNDAPKYALIGAPNVCELLKDLAGEIEAMPCPGTVTVVDEEGRRLL